jgi:hypothetical protein
MSADKITKTAIVTRLVAAYPTFEECASGGRELAQNSDAVRQKLKLEG